MIDQLQLYRGKDYEVNSYIKIRQPTLEQIADYGERRYFAIIKTMCATPADRKVEIWDALHIYWDEMDEYTLFQLAFSAICKDDLRILLPGLDTASFQPVKHLNTGEIVLRNNDGVVIDRAIHALIVPYIRTVHFFQKNVDVGYDDYTKDIMIEDDRNDNAVAATKPFSSILQPLISALTNCADFKYRFDDIWMLPIGAFMDAIRRIQKIRDYEHLCNGVYSGSIDIKKINKSKEFDWMGDMKV